MEFRHFFYVVGVIIFFSHVWPAFFSCNIELVLLRLKLPQFRALMEVINWQEYISCIQVRTIDELERFLIQTTPICPGSIEAENRILYLLTRVCKLYLLSSVITYMNKSLQFEDVSLCYGCDTDTVCHTARAIRWWPVAQSPVTLW